MSDETRRQFDSDLIELHLGRLSNAETDALHTRIAADAALAEQHRDLTDVFAALRSVAEVKTPARLAERAAAHVAAAGRPPRVHGAPQPNGDERGPLWLLPFRVSTFRDIVAVAAMIVLAVGLGVPGLLNVRERNQRIVCARNLAMVGQGLQTYASAYNNSLPFAGWSPSSSWLQTESPDVEVQPNRRHPYRLVLKHYAAPTAFVCPSRMHAPMSDNDIATHDDFPEATNVSFAFQNMAGVRPSLQDDPRLPVMADENPLFQDGLSLLDLVRVGAKDQDRNSFAHRGAGQNVLLLNGKVVWKTEPHAGIDGDNIWTLAGVSEYSGREGPTSTKDAHLLK